MSPKAGAGWDCDRGCGHGLVARQVGHCSAKGWCPGDALPTIQRKHRAQTVGLMPDGVPRHIYDPMMPLGF